VSCGLVPLCIAPWGLKIDVPGRVLAESRSPAVRILGSVPLLPADTVAHDLLFATPHQEFSGCQAIFMASVPTNSFLWDYVRESNFISWKFLSYAMHGVRLCHVIPLPATVESYFANFSGKRRYNVKRQTRIRRDHFGGRLELRTFDSPNQIGDLFNAITPRGEFAQLMRWGQTRALTTDRREAESLSARGLLLIYLLIGAGRPCAALVGMKYKGAYYVDSIPRDRSLDRFSPGSTAVYVAIEELIPNTSIRRIDMGFGSPTYPHSATNATEPRASLLLFRKTLSNRLRRLTHATFEKLVEVGKAQIEKPSTPRRQPTKASTSTASVSWFGREIGSHSTR
jgi:Acetyltransferase (GNAT) domain